MPRISALLCMIPGHWWHCHARTEKPRGSPSPCGQNRPLSCPACPPTAPALPSPRGQAPPSMSSPSPKGVQVWVCSMPTRPTVQPPCLPLESSLSPPAPAQGRSQGDPSAQKAPASRTQEESPTRQPLPQKSPMTSQALHPVRGQTIPRRMLASTAQVTVCSRGEGLCVPQGPRTCRRPDHSTGPLERASLLMPVATPPQSPGACPRSRSTG